MKTAGDVFNAAMGLMDELDETGTARTGKTKEYEYRAPGIVNGMISEYRILDGRSGSLVPVEGLEDPLLSIDDTYAAGVMPYGLAAHLLVDENPAAASFYEQRYEEMRNIYFSRRAAGADGAVEDLYGGIEYGQFARW